MLAQENNSLSVRDQKTLNTVLGALEVMPKSRVDLALPPDQHITDTAKVEKLVAIEKRSILLEKDGKVDEALALMDKVIQQEPRYASAYNNRAQLRRLKEPETVCPPGVLSDLESAIALALPTRQRGTLSKMQASVSRNAYGQLAAIYLSKSKEPENASEAWNSQMKASNMMVEASNYGEHIAASSAASINPYAKLCGNMIETVSQYYR